MTGPAALNTSSAYRLGWDASRRSTNGDMDAAEARFLRRHGHFHVEAWCAGWSEQAELREEAKGGAGDA